MKALTIVNVNPGTNPAGALNPELRLKAIRNRVLRQGTSMARRKSGRLLRRLFGSTSLSIALSTLLLIARVGFGVWLVMAGCNVILSGGAPAFSAALIAGGVVVALGFFTRIIMGIGAVLFGYLAYTGWIDGLMPLTATAVWGVMTLLSLAGPGRFSCDSVMRCNIFKAVRRRQMHRLLQNRFSYRAYEFAHMQ